MTIAGHIRHDAGNEAHGAKGRGLDEWMDGLMDTFLPQPQAESVFKACSAFAFELN